MMKRCGVTLRGVAMLATVLAGGCTSAAGTTAERATVTDSAGVEIREYAGELPDRRATLELVWTHGHAPDDYPIQFAMLGAIRSDRSAVVADVGNEEIVRIDETGARWAVLAAAGQGPGEVRFPGGVIRVGLDSVWVADRGNAKLMLFARDSLVNMISTQGDRTLSRAFIPSGATEDGRLLLTTGSYRTDFEEEWLDGHLARFDPLTRALDTLGTYPMAPRRPESGLNPFQATGHVDGAGDGFVHSRSDVPQVTWRDGDGAVTRIVRWQPAAVYPTDGLWAAFEEGMRADLARLNPALGEDALRDFVEQQVASFTVDASVALPLFQQLRGASDGSVWLADFVAGNSFPSGYTIVSADGARSGHVDFPGPFLVIDIVGDLVLGVTKDEFDVQALVLYRYHFPEDVGGG